MTFYVDSGRIVFDLTNGTSQEAAVTYNGNPPPGDYLDVAMEDGRLRATPPLGGTPNEKGNVIQWRAPEGVHISVTPPVLLTVRKGGPAITAPGEQGTLEPGSGGVSPTPSTTADELYFRYNSRFSFGLPSARESRRVGEHVVDWARVRGRLRTGSDATIKRLQTEPNADTGIINAIHLHLIERIRDGITVDPETGESEPDDFEGSPKARDKAILTLERYWDPVGQQLGLAMRWSFDRAFDEALGRRGLETELVLDPAQVIRIRTQPTNALLPSNRWNDKYKVGDRVGEMIIADFDSGFVYFTLRDNPLWLYKTGRDAFLRTDPFMTVVRTLTYEGSRLAGELWPLMIKAGGFGATLAGGWAGIVVGIALDELGEEGLRAARGEPPRSAAEMLKSAGTELFVQGVLHIAFKVAPRFIGKTPGKAVRVTMEELEGQGAEALRGAVVESEGPLVERELYARHARRVTDPAMVEKGYVREVDVRVEGEPHTYRELEDGTWCRYSEDPLCLNLGADVKTAAGKEPGMKEPKEGSAQGTGTKTKSKWEMSREERELLEAPRKGETPEEWAMRTHEDWNELPEPARKSYIDAAPEAMEKARIKVAIRDPKTRYQHYLTAGGYEDILRSQSLRSGSGVTGWGGGDAVRAKLVEEYTGPPTKTTIDFIAINPPEPPYIRPHVGGPYVAFPMLEGDFLKIEMLRIRYANGAVAYRLALREPTHWRLTYGTMQKIVTLEDLIRLGERPTLP